MSFVDKIKISTLTIIASLIPLLLFSFVETIIILKREESNNLKYQHQKKITLKNKIAKAKEGFIPIYYPESILKHFFSSNTYPIGTLPYKNTFSCDEGYGLTTFKSDRFGLRNKDFKWDKINTKNSIFFIGDSSTHGDCVDDNSTFIEIFSKAKKINSLNLGNGGSGPYEYISVLKTVMKPIINGIKTSEKIVVLVFYDNDKVKKNKKKSELISKIGPIVEINANSEIHPSTNYISLLKKFIELNYPTKQEDILETLKSQLIEEQEKYEDFFIVSNTIKRTITLYPIRKRIHQLFYGTKNSENNPSLLAIKELQTICKTKFSCKPYVAYIPNSDFWDPDPLSITYKLQLKKISENFNIKFLDSSIVINSSDKGNYAPMGMHLSKLGYRKLANFLAKEIEY